MLKEYHSNSLFGRLHQKEWREWFRFHGRKVLWSYIEQRHPEIVSESKSLHESKTLLCPHKSMYSAIEHFPAKGKYKGVILCLPPLGYSSGYFYYCFSEILLLTQCGYDICIVNYPAENNSFEDIADVFIGEILQFLQSKGLGDIKIWCGVGIGNLFIERNAALGENIELGILINPPLRPISLDKVHPHPKLHLPKYIRHAYLLFEEFEKLTSSTLKAERKWRGISKGLQDQWRYWIHIGGFSYEIDNDESIFFIDLSQSRIPKKMIFYMENHPFFHEGEILKKQSEFKNMQILSSTHLPKNFIDLFSVMLK
jgi:hypothetical protein